MSQKLVAARGGRSYKGTRSCHRHTWNMEHSEQPRWILSAIGIYRQLTQTDASAATQASAKSATVKIRASLRILGVIGGKTSIGPSCADSLQALNQSNV